MSKPIQLCCFYGHCPAGRGRHIVEISVYPGLVTLSKQPILFAWFTSWVAGGQLGGRRRLSMEDNLPWKTTFDGRQPLIEDNLRWKTTLDGRRPSMEDNLWWKTTFYGRPPSVEDDLYVLVLFSLPELLTIRSCSLKYWPLKTFG